MPRLHDLVYMTSTSTGSPFTTSSVTGYNDFQDFYNQDETFNATFKDGSDHYLVALCHLNGSNQVVIDKVIMSSAGARNLTVPTFSGTVDIAIAPAAHFVRNRRLGNWDPSDASHLEYIFVDHSGAGVSTAAATVTADTLMVFDFEVEIPGWYYRLFLSQKGSGAGTGDYYAGIYDIDVNHEPNVLLCSTGSVAHGNANVDTESDFNTALTITNITQANPGVVTYTGTDPSNGDRIYITDVAGMTEVNDTSYLIANVNTGSNTFELQDLTATNVNTTGYTAYSSAGTVHLPIFLAAGDYIGAITADTNDLRFVGFDADEKARFGWTGCRTGGGTCASFQKSYTYAALPTNPTSTGTWTDNATFKPLIGLKMVTD